MFFPIEADEQSKALGQIRRLRHSGNWHRISSSDAYWTTPFFVCLVETIDSLLLEKPEKALILSLEGILLAERIRPEQCPGGDEVGKQSLRVWAHAVQGSSLRVLDRLVDAESSFQEASRFSERGVLPWASAELQRRWAALHLQRGSEESFVLLEAALVSYPMASAARTDVYVLRGLCHQYLRGDLASAALEMGKALEIGDPKASPRQERSWSAAIHNLSLIYAKGLGDLSTLGETLKKVRKAKAKLTGHEVFRRKLCEGVEALLLAPLGSLRQAERILNRVCRWFFKHRHFHRGAMASLDLALLLSRAGETSAAKGVLIQLAAELMQADVDVRASLGGWLENCLQNGLVDLEAESLAPIREALSSVAASKPHPLGTIESPISGFSAGSDGSDVTASSSD